MTNRVLLVDLNQPHRRVVLRTLGLANTQQLTAMILWNEPVVFRVDDQHLRVGLKQTERDTGQIIQLLRDKQRHFEEDCLLFCVVESNIGRLEGFSSLLDYPSVIQKQWRYDVVLGSLLDVLERNLEDHTLGRS